MMPPPLGWGGERPIYTGYSNGGLRYILYYSKKSVLICVEQRVGLE